MSKIDDYKKISALNGRDIGDLNEALGNHSDGTPNSNNDKHHIRFNDKRIWDSDLPLFLHMSYGYYGSSSGYSVGGGNIQGYIEKALNIKAAEIVKTAIDLMEIDILKARKASKAEAEEILRKLNEEPAAAMEGAI